MTNTTHGKPPATNTARHIIRIPSPTRWRWRARWRKRAALVDLQGELTSIENIQAVAIEGIAQGIAAQDDLDEANAQLAGEAGGSGRAKQADVDAAAQDAAELLEEMKAITQQCSFEDAVHRRRA